MNVDVRMPACIDICQSEVSWASNDGGAAALSSSGCSACWWSLEHEFDTGRGDTSRLVLSHADAGHLQAAGPGGPHRSHAHPQRTGIRGRPGPGRAGRSVDGRAGHPSRRLPRHPVPAVRQPTTAAPRARPPAAADGSQPHPRHRPGAGRPPRPGRAVHGRARRHGRRLPRHPVPAGSRQGGAVCRAGPTLLALRADRGRAGDHGRPAPGRGHPGHRPGNGRRHGRPHRPAAAAAVRALPQRSRPPRRRRRQPGCGPGDADPAAGGRLPGPADGRRSPAPDGPGPGDAGPGRPDRDAPAHAGLGRNPSPALAMGWPCPWRGSSTSWSGCGCGP